MFNAIKQFNKTVWLIIISTFAARFTFFMIWPFMALILYEKFELNELEIGGFLAVAVFIGIACGFVVGNISDRVGRRKIILLGLVFQVISLSLLGMAQSLELMLGATVLQSIARTMTENPGKALMTDMMKDREVKDMALHMRYYMLNVGAALGPVAGVYIGITGQQTTFFVAASMYALYLGAAGIVFNIEKPLKRTKMATDQSFKALFSLLRQDHSFLLFVFASFLAFITYAQIDTGLLQYLRQQGIENLRTLFAQLIFINGLTIIIFQFPMLKWLKNVQPLNRAIIGVVMFFIAHLTFAFTPATQVWGLMLAMFILSFGEVILFPTMSILVDRMAPEHLKGSYFGAAALGGLGFSAAPLVGGYLLYEYGGFTLWTSMAAITILVGILLYIAQTAKRPDIAAVKD
ncbi:MAG: MFS transporter [Rhizobiales bacterium]|nr:MFS transporter [Hyphomicrobiales bacterium]NRB15328.1 MFS transporter [Hyphomicrobiales bacterium]